jgi:hypothetical protein
MWLNYGATSYYYYIEAQTRPFAAAAARLQNECEIHICLLYWRLDRNYKCIYDHYNTLSTNYIVYIDKEEMLQTPDPNERFLLFHLVCLSHCMNVCLQIYYSEQLLLKIQVFYLFDGNSTYF